MHYLLLWVTRKNTFIWLKYKIRGGPKTVYFHEIKKSVDNHRKHRGYDTRKCVNVARVPATGARAASAS